MGLCVCVCVFVHLWFVCESKYFSSQIYVDSILEDLALLELRQDYPSAYVRDATVDVQCTVYN